MEIDFRDYEPVPLPEFKSPRDMLLYMTGKDYESLINPCTGIDFTWEELRKTGADQHVLNILMLSTHQPIVFRKKS